MLTCNCLKWLHTSVLWLWHQSNGRKWKTESHSQELIGWNFHLCHVQFPCLMEVWAYVRWQDYVCACLRVQVRVISPGVCLSVWVGVTAGVCTRVIFRDHCFTVQTVAEAYSGVDEWKRCVDAGICNMYIDWLVLFNLTDCDDLFLVVCFIFLLFLLLLCAFYVRDNIVISRNGMVKVFCICNSLFSLFLL